MKCGGIKFGRSEMALRVVGSSDALARNPQKVCIQFPVRILIVEDGYRIGAGSYSREIADRMLIADSGRAARNCLIRLLRKVSRRRKQGAKCLTLIIAQSDNVDMNLVLGRRLRLCENCGSG